MTMRAFRYHDFSYGHCVHNHESKCAHLHGHNGRVFFYCEAPELDSVGRVIDFSVIKERLCSWVERSWDHRFLVSHKDPRAARIVAMDSEAVVTVFNPTAENMADHLLRTAGPYVLAGTGVTLTKVELWETRKCGVTAAL
jgi:6-pyruvoyltetrahydropterin/6-carboxytetrahydropterin synthase